MYRHDLASGWHQIGEDRWVDGQPGVGVEMLGALESEIDSAPWLVFAGRHRHDMGAGWHSRAEGRVCLKRVCFYCRPTWIQTHFPTSSCVPFFSPPFRL